MKKWGVKVSLVQPSGFNTGGRFCFATPTERFLLATIYWHWWTLFHISFSGGFNHNILKEKRNTIWNSLDSATKAAYGRNYLDGICDNFESSVPRYPKDLTPVIRALRSGLLSKRPREKLTVGPGAGTFLMLYPLLPVRIADFVSSTFGFSDEQVKPVGLQNQWG